MSNVIRFCRQEPSRPGEASSDQATEALLARAVLSATGEASLPQTKEELQRVVLLLELTSMRARLVISRIADGHAQQRLLADASVIEGMIEIVRRKVASL